MEGRSDDVAYLDALAERAGLGRGEQLRGDPQGVLDRDRFLRHGPCRLVGVEEQVADLVQVDLTSGPYAELLESGKAADPERDIDRVGELRAHAAGRLRGRSACERVLLEQQHVGHAGLSEMERRARAHDPAADDDDLGAVGKARAHPKFTPCASGSESE